MNKRNVATLKRKLRQAPDRYDQSSFRPRERDYEQVNACNGQVESTCRTACCLAGHAYMLAKDIKRFEIRVSSLSRLQHVAREWLGLTPMQGEVLFGGTHLWPDRFRFSTTDPQSEQVDKACAFLDHIAKTGEVYDSTNVGEACDFVSDDVFFAAQERTF